MEDQIEHALHVLHVIEQEKMKCGLVNAEIRAWQDSDFPTHLHAMSPSLEEAVVEILDAVLGDGIASYYLYETCGMKSGGRIVENGKEWPIRDISDVERFVRRVR